MPPTPDHFALIRLVVGELGLPLYEPFLKWE
jgi:hypothetical protein